MTASRQTAKIIPVVARTTTRAKVASLANASLALILAMIDQCSPTCSPIGA